MKARLVLVGTGLLLLSVVVAFSIGTGSSRPSRSRVADAAETPRPSGSVVARASAPLDVFAEAGATTPSLTLPARTGHGSPRALLVVEHRADWLEVALPVRGGHAKGWVRAGDVGLRAVSTSVVVDINRRRLIVYDSGRKVFSSPVAVGTAENPTPVGEFFVTDLLAVPDAGGPYGPFAIGLSAYSETLTEFAGGDGQVGIHGTNEPGRIGSAASHGCIRLPNEAIARLFELVSLGTPVVLG